jgi:hypothetical protein
MSLSPQMDEVAEMAPNKQTGGCSVREKHFSASEVMLDEAAQSPAVVNTTMHT